MRYAVAPVKNVTALGAAGQALTTRATGLPGMGVVWGPTGYGKTTASAWLRNKVDGIYIRALAVWTPTTMLGAIAKELGGRPMARSAHMAEFIIEKLEANPRPLMIDEADYVVDSAKMVDTLRDLHDQSSAPVILIGMAGIQRSIAHRKQLAGRIQQWVEFQPADLDDARTLARTLCEVTIEDELLARLHGEAKGSARLMVVGMSRIEAWAKARGMDAARSADWGKQDFFFGDAPKKNGGQH